MGLASSIKAGEAFFEIIASDKTAKGIDSAEARLRRFGAQVGLIGTAMAAFGAAGIASIGIMMRKFAGAGDELSDAMNVTGISSDFLQTLQFGAADAGVGFNALIGSLSKFNALVAKTAAKGGSIVGLDAKSLLAMNPDKRILAVVDAIERIPNPAQRAAAAIQAFGKSGAKLLPMFEGGGQSLIDAMKEMKDSGEIMSDEDRQLATDTEAAYLTLGLRLTRISQLISAAVAPAFLALASGVNSALKMAIRFLDNNRALVAGITIAVGVIGLAGAALMAFGAAAIAASFITAGLTMVTTAFAAVLTFITSPLFVIAAALTACGVAAGVAAYGLDQALNAGKGLTLFKSIAADIGGALNGVWDAIVGGEWELAGSIMAAGLTSGFKSGLLEMREATTSFSNWAAKAFAGLVAMPQIAAADIMGDQRAASDLRANLQEQRSIIDQDKDYRFDKEREDANEASAKYKALLEQAKALKKPSAMEGFDFSNIASSADEGIRNVQTLGAQGSIAASMLSQSAPGNTIQEKMLAVAEESNETLSEIADTVAELENLTLDVE